MGAVVLVGTILLNMCKDLYGIINTLRRRNEQVRSRFFK